MAIITKANYSDSLQQQSGLRVTNLRVMARGTYDGVSVWTDFGKTWTMSSSEAQNGNITITSVGEVVVVAHNDPVSTIATTTDGVNWQTSPLQYARYVSKDGTIIASQQIDRVAMTTWLMTSHDSGKHG